MAPAEVYRWLGEQALAWVLAHVSYREDGPWLPPSIATDDTPGSTEPDEFRDSVYDGIGGLGLLLAEVQLSRPWTAAEATLVRQIVERLTTQAAHQQDATLYGGLAGTVTTVRLLAPGRETGALDRLLELATPQGWVSTEGDFAGQPISDVVMGNAGIVLTGAWHGSPAGLELVKIGAKALLLSADRVEDGLDWAMSPITVRRMPNFSHGTAGVVAALTAAGQALEQERYLDAARLGAEHLVAVGDRSTGGLRLPTIIPWEAKDGEEFTYSWCHGPTGTAYAFAALQWAGLGAVDGLPPGQWRASCLHAIRTSGIPERIRPGFWDNDGRCCGTAGAGAVFLDEAQAQVGSAADGGAYAGQCLSFAASLGDALVQRAIVDEHGARWRFVEHRLDHSLLAPGTGWMQGAAGIAAYLLRLARVLDEGVDALVLDLPDQWWAVPPHRTVTRGAREMPSGSLTG